MHHPNCTPLIHPVQSVSTIKHLKHSVKAERKIFLQCKQHGYGTWGTNKQNKNSICTLRAAISQSVLLLPPRSFVTERRRDRLQLRSCFVLHKSHRESLWSTDAWVNQGFSPPRFNRLPTRGRGSTVTGGDPELTSPCVATETEELRKREEVRALGVTTRQSEGGRERIGVFLFMCNCLCPPPSRHCHLSSRRRHLWHTHTHTHTHAAVDCWAPQAEASPALYSLRASLIHCFWSGSLQSAPPVTRRSFFTTQLASSKMAGRWSSVAYWLILKCFEQL